MTDGEFEKIWRLLGSLWPSASAKKSKVDIAVWRKGLSCFAMTEISDRIMQYAQANKFFPDLSDITAGLKPEEDGKAEIEAATIHTAKLLARIKGIEIPQISSAAEAMEWYRGLEAKT